MTGEPTAIDLFSGAGGFTEGLTRAGFDVLWAIDSKEECATTFRQNHPEVEFEVADIREIEPPELPVEDLDLLAGGPPCPTFSVVGRSKMNSLEQHVLTDDRHYLFEEYIRFVEHYRPQTLLMENVPGMRSATTESGENVVRRIKRELRDAGYRVTVREVEAADFGVPQRRKRLFFIGNRSGIDNPILEHWATHRKPRNDDERELTPARKDDNQSTLDDFGADITRSIGSFCGESNHREPWVTVGDAILDLPPVSPSGEKPPTEAEEYTIPPVSEYQQWVRDALPDADPTDMELTDHACRGHNMYDLTLYKLLGASAGWSSANLDDELHPYRADVFEDQYTKQASREPASTITAHLAKDGHMSIHPTEARSLTVREAARLQSFEDSFRFPVPRSSGYEQIGNAVPPLVAEALATALLKDVLRG
ncbi:DNA cytosine methyltransferase [Salinarchaeum laminariae]|uniref:DNA cytosine methyltransferase n=1 Tax=Salinarchaeum laminariae TaxID=869888 RepID=UPI0020C11B15|nr:DNA cytosine methyltransferase [Salinarchaeum laminariae]